MDPSQEARCELHKQDGDLDGEAAEQYLAELLGFEFPGRGSSKPEHWGIPGLLWIEQGTGQDIAESVGNATDHLRKALDRSVSDVSSGMAYADLLKEAGRPTLIILDDALVHTDAQRLEQMKRVIFDASKRHQVLVFSCHPAAWKNVGANPVAIDRTAQV